MTPLEISLSGCAINDCIRGINNINEAFLNIDQVLLYNSDDIHVKVTTGFIPGKILVLFGYYLDSLGLKGKRITLHGKKEFIDFITKCGLKDYVRNQEVDYHILKNSVIIPFCNVSTADKLEYHFGHLINRTNFDYSTITVIMQFLGELHNNSRIHGGTNKIYIMGQYYPNYGQYDITIYDDGKGMLIDDSTLIEEVYSSFIEKSYKEEIEKKYGLNVLFIILCMCTRFSTKGPKIGGLGLYDLSNFLCNKNGYINIASGIEYIRLDFNQVSHILNNQSIRIFNTKLNHEIKGTYISFTFSQ